MAAAVAAAACAVAVSGPSVPFAPEPGCVVSVAVPTAICAAAGLAQARHAATNHPPRAPLPPHPPRRPIDPWSPRSVFLLQMPSVAVNVGGFNMEGPHPRSPARNSGEGPRWGSYVRLGGAVLRGEVRRHRAR